MRADATSYVGLLGGTQIDVEDGLLHIVLPPCGGEIYAPVCDEDERVEQLGDAELLEAFVPAEKPELDSESGVETSGSPAEDLPVEVPSIPLEQMTVEQLQAVILSKMAANGPVTDQMRRDVTNNIWPDSLLNWAKSFR